MKRGKRICKTLKEVRMLAAKVNDIKYAPSRWIDITSLFTYKF